MIKLCIKRGPNRINNCQERVSIPGKFPSTSSMGVNNYSITIQKIKQRLTQHAKGPSKNVNIFMSVQTVHFFRPPPPKVYKPAFWGSKTRASHSTIFIVQQQKLTCLRSLLCDKWYLWLWIMIYRLQLIWYTSKFNLNIYFLCIQRKYGQFHNIKFKMPTFQLLIWLETSFKNWQKAQHVNIYFLSKVYIYSYPLPPLHSVCTLLKMLTIMDGP